VEYGAAFDFCKSRQRAYVMEFVNDNGIGNESLASGDLLGNAVSPAIRPSLKRVRAP